MVWNSNEVEPVPTNKESLQCRGIRRRNAGMPGRIPQVLRLTSLSEKEKWLNDFPRPELR